MELAERSTNRSEQKSRRFLKSLIRKQPQDLLWVIGTGASATVVPGIPVLCSQRGCIEAFMPGIPVLCSRRGCIEAFIKAAEQLDVLHSEDVAEFCKRVIRDRDFLVVVHDLIRKMSPVLQWARDHIKYGVLHIHGMYTDSCGMVLDPPGYKDVTQDPKNVLQNLYHTKSFLSWGCGETLHDQIFQGLFLYTVKNNMYLEHYMLVPKENKTHSFKLQTDMLLHGIKIVSYGDCFEYFPDCVQDLTAQTCMQ